jgi:hypothetical protein
LKNLVLLLAYTFIILSCTVYSKNSYYTGDKYQDSVIKSVDNRLKTAEKIKVDWRKKQFGNDSNLVYAVNKLNNELLSIGFSELKADKRTSYTLLKGELVKVIYHPNHRKGEVSNIYFYENGRFIYERHRNADSPDAQKFLDDIDFFKKALETK